MIGASYEALSSHHTTRLGKKKDEITPYDFFTDPVTGKRPKEDREPYSGQRLDLTRGIEDTVLIPLSLWRKGIWLSVLADQPESEEYKALPKFLQDKCEKVYYGKGVSPDIYNFWVTYGEGYPNNNLVLAWELPTKYCSEKKPKHPLMWDEFDRKKPTIVTYGGYGGGYTTPTTPAKKALPANLKSQCECGHWFPFDKIMGHYEVCSLIEGNDGMTAVPCDPQCGCGGSLDVISKPKLGFPKAKPAAVAVEKTVEAVGEES